MWDQLSGTSYTKVEGGRDKQVGWQSNDLKDKWDSKGYHTNKNGATEIQNVCSGWQLEEKNVLILGKPATKILKKLTFGIMSHFCQLDYLYMLIYLKGIVSFQN